MQREKRLTVFLSDEELTTFRMAAARRGCTAPVYLRMLAVTASETEAPTTNKNTQHQKLEAKKGGQKVKTFDECLAEDIAAQRTTAMALADEWDECLAEDIAAQRTTDMALADEWEAAIEKVHGLSEFLATIGIELAKRHSPLLDD